VNRRDIAWPAGIAAALAARYAAESLRHRREHGDDGYTLHGDALDVRDERFMATCEALTGAPISVGDDVDLLINGDEIFPAFLETIRGAERTINLLTYVYWRGDICDDMADALVGRVQEGVEVNVLLDAIGTLKMDPRTIGHMRDGGVRVAPVPPAQALRDAPRDEPHPPQDPRRRRPRRDDRRRRHRRGVDGQRAGPRPLARHPRPRPRPDRARPAGRLRRELARGHRRGARRPAPPPDLAPVEDGEPMQVVRSSAGVGDTEAEALYFLALASARTRLDLTAAYFAPRPAFVAALGEAAARGVEVRVLVPGPHIDKGFVRIAGRAVYEELLDAGVRIWEYQPTMLHAKTMTVDGAWSSVGSVNFDNRSFQLHDEATLCVQSERFAGRLTEQFERDLEVSEEIRRGRFARRPAHHRAQERVLQLARREL
jgi:cardiolipin synthase